MTPQQFELLIEATGRLDRAMAAPAEALRTMEAGLNQRMDALEARMDQMEARMGAQGRGGGGAGPATGVRRPDSAGLMCGRSPRKAPCTSGEQRRALTFNGDELVHAVPGPGPNDPPLAQVTLRRMRPRLGCNGRARRTALPGAWVKR